MTEGGFVGEGMWAFSEFCEGTFSSSRAWSSGEALGRTTVLGRLLHTVPFVIWRSGLPSLDSLLCRGSACSPGLREPGLHCDAE